MARLHTFAQSDYWTAIDETTIAAATEGGTRQIIPNAYKTFHLNANAWREHLANAPMEGNAAENTLTIDLPMPNGTVETFAIVESPIMAAGLAEEFPEIKTYLGQGITNPRAMIRFDWTYKGFHAMIISEKGSVFIDPYHSATTSEYIIYNKKDFTTPKSFTCHTPQDEKILDDPHQHDEPLSPNSPDWGEELRTYRLALACTGEYTQFHGGVSGAMSAMVTTMNRVNGVYEMEVAIRMIIIANNSQLIYTNASSDPYTNNNGAQMLGQNQNNIDNVIGSVNYDIGHVFSTGGGGIASLRSPCNNGQKARGVTGLSVPVGDPFDIDYVCHEMGHQFGGNHTFNGNVGSCAGGNRNGSTAYEPGSATTIMGYAGICGNQNIQNNSDPFFHTVSFDEMIAFSVNGSGNNCPVITSTGNTRPNVSAGTGGYTIPRSTPFTLTGSATDPDGDPLTYSWEQFDLGPAGAPNNPTGNAPLFRSFSPVTEPVRTFPQISDIINNTQTLGELLPIYSRNLNFRLTARDNKAGGGGVNYDGITISVDANSGPFLVTEPNTSAANWTEGLPATVTWDVANTDVAPVDCPLVDILLSVDGGLTYTVVLATGVPNNGSHTFVVPANVATNQARVRVQCASNVFFDISNQNFTINAPTVPTYVLYPITDVAATCAADAATFEIDVIALLNYSDAVNITASGVPTGVTLSFNNNPITPGNILQVTASAADSMPTGVYPITLFATSSARNDSIVIQLTVYSSSPTPVTPIFPEDGNASTASNLIVEWTAAGASHIYDLQVATDPLFTNLVVDVTGLTTETYLVSGLASYTVYYWRIKASNDCVAGEFSAPFTFRTSLSGCNTYVYDTPVFIIPPLPNLVYEAPLEVTNGGTITDVNILNLRGEHTYISDLSFWLESPSGTEVSLFSNICTNQNDFNIGFDDDAPNSNYPCPPTNGGIYKPQELLANFNTENSNGTWTMHVEDNAAGDGGSLDYYELEICQSVASTNEDPVIVNNLGDTVEVGASTTLSTDLLLATDADHSASELVYTILATPTSGTLALDGAALGTGDTLFQTDIDAGSLAYTHTGSAAGSDAFRFHVEDGAGGWTGSPNFNITITAPEPEVPVEPTTPQPAVGQAIIYPNPTSAILNIAIHVENDETLSFIVYNAIGQRAMRSENIAASRGVNNFTLDTAHLSNGVYVLVIEGEAFTIIEKVIVSK